MNICRNVPIKGQVKESLNIYYLKRMCISIWEGAYVMCNNKENRKSKHNPAERKASCMSLDI